MKTGTLLKTVISLIIGLSVIAGLYTITGCEKQNGGEPEDPIQIALNAPEQELAVRGKSFTFSLLTSVIESEEEDVNISISPFSLNSALAMLMNGASGATKDSIGKAMGFDGFTASDVNNYFKKVREAVLKTDKSAKILIANSIWYRQEATPQTLFINLNKTFYNAEIKPLDFTDQESAGIINQWCSDNTNGLIDKVIETIKPEDFMYLINALYFKAPWQKGYEFDPENTASGNFNLAGGGSAGVSMMKNDFNVSYYSDQNLSMISIPYGNGAFAMHFFLPAQGKSCETIANSLIDEVYLNKIISESAERKVSAYIPRFKFKYDIGLNNILQSRGMSIAYDPLRADFTDSFKGVPLVVTDVKQFNYINVDEEGTEAAAVTSITVGLTSMPQTTEFRLDRPFLYAIRENTSGVILFAGRVGNPASEGK
ncbi:MAG: serpin family protein [Bacteroidales bacterium]|nr:serpin family protein [Bacteroidales bacterium]MDD2425776.1 serpin family protein [Bacteroidales bacterium]MDD3990112.1 serpin family protein [Bacteroidales bacterium]